MAAHYLRMGDDKEEEKMVYDDKVVQEKMVYDEVHEYLTKSTYSVSATKVEKATVRRRAKNFQVLDGILYYTGPKGDAKKQVK